VSKRPDGFVSIGSLRSRPGSSGTADGGAARPDAALDEIRRIYFETTKKTIEGDFAHAIELLKSLPSDEARERATVFMHGLHEMRREWQARAGGPGKAPQKKAEPRGIARKRVRARVRPTSR
jgi:hypothetical protein